MFSAAVQRKLNARHFLQGVGQEEAHAHNHPYLVQWRCSSRKLNALGFAADIARMEAGLEAVLSEIDSLLLNDLPFFRSRQPSLEHLALFLHGRLSALEIDCAAARPQHEVRIWESDSAWAAYSK